MGDNLHDLNRKELKELCGQNNIRTAGVKHEDLVRLLRNKLYPSTPQSSRAMKGRGPKLPSPGKEDGDSFKTPAKTAGKATRSSRSVTLPREDVPASSTRKNMSGLSRKPLLAKSNTVQSRRPPDLGMKSIGVEHDAQEHFVRRLCQCNAVSPLSRRGLEATGHPGKPSRLSLVHSDSKSEGMASPRPSELSDGGSDASRRVSEIATDAGPDTMSDFGSDADDFRSVSSEPMSKLSSISKRNASRTESQSKLSLLGGHSFLTPGTSWGTAQGDDHSRTMDNLLADGDRRDSTEIIFPEFSEGSNFLVGGTDALDLSFLHAGAPDPDVIVKDKFDVMESPMARDYVTYNRGSEADISDGNSIGSNRASVGETSSEHRDSPAEIKHEHAEPRTDDCVDGPEIHSELPCLESHSPPFDSKDYSVAKKLVFGPEEDITLPASLQDDVQGPEVSEERSVVPVPEENDSATIIEDTSSEEVNRCNSQNSEGPVPAIIERSHFVEEPAISSETPREDTSSEEVNGSNSQNSEEGPVPAIIERRHSIEEPAVDSETPLEDTSSEEVDGSNSQNGEEGPVPAIIERRHSIEEPAADSETPLEDTSSEEVNGSNSQNSEEGPVPAIIARRHSIEEPAVDSETPLEDTSSGSNSQNGEEPVPETIEESHSVIEEPAVNCETPPSTIEDTSSEEVSGEEPAVNGDTPPSTIEDTASEEVNGEEPAVNGETPPSTIEDTSSEEVNGEEPAVNDETPPSTIEDTSPEEVNGEEPVSKTIEGRYSVVLSIEEPAVNGETPPSTIDESTGEGPEPNTTLVERDFTPHSKVSEPTSNDDVAETLMESISSDMTNGEDGFTSKQEFDEQPHRQESDTKVPFDQDTAIVEKHVDVPSVAKIASDKAAPESDEHEGYPAYESDVKAGDGLYASTSTAIVLTKEEDTQVCLPFPLSFVMWCSQVCCSQVCCPPVCCPPVCCPPLFRNRSSMLES